MGATGLGCFLDSASLETFGLQDSGLAALYHFTIGHLPQSAKNERARYPPFDFRSGHMLDLDDAAAESE